MTDVAEQFDLLGDTLLARPPLVGVVHVASYVRRPRGQRRALGTPPAPVPESAAERNRWVLDRLEAWRKAHHAASQARSKGALLNRGGDEQREKFRNLVCEAEFRRLAEEQFVLARQHEARAAGLIAQITERVR